MSVEITKRGFLDTIQDMGRFGFERYGVSRSGAADSFALMAANVLVGNAWGEAGLEVTLVGPTLRFHQDAVIAMTGADLSPTINGHAVRLWTSILVSKGSVLEFGMRNSGCRTYIAVAGGFRISREMESKSTNLQAKFGGFAGRALAEGDILRLDGPLAGVDEIVGRVLPAEYRPKYADSITARVILGPQDDHFTAAGLATLLSAEYNVDLTSDRIGCRLIGPPIEHAGPNEIISDGVPLGAIQVPPDGRPIVLLADHQTVGGYPKIATVITADIHLVAQCQPGTSRVKFHAVSLEEAHNLYHTMYSALHRIRRL